MKTVGSSIRCSSPRGQMLNTPHIGASQWPNGIIMLISARLISSPENLKLDSFRKLSHLSLSFQNQRYKMINDRCFCGRIKSLKASDTFHPLVLLPRENIWTVGSSWDSSNDVASSILVQNSTTARVALNDKEQLQCVRANWIIT